MRPHPQGPWPPAAPVASAVAATPVPTFLPPVAPRAPAAPAAPVDSAPPANEGDSAAEQAARAGGFHESSYELQNGLQVSESEWPDDVTVPGQLGER